LAAGQGTPLLRGTSFINSVSWTPAGRLVFEKLEDGKRQIWIMDADGNHQQLLSSDQADDMLPVASPDGYYIVYLSNRSGSRELWRMDIDGRNPKQLTTGNASVWLPRFAADGQSVFFEMDRGQRTVLARIPITGGTPIEVVNDVPIMAYDFSPDGRQIAYSFTDPAQGKLQVAVRSIAGGGPVRYYDFAPGEILRWAPDGQGLLFEQPDPNGTASSAIWLQPMAGGSPRELVNFDPDTIYWADFSRDGKRLAFVRGRLISDLVLVSRRKEP